MPSRWLPMPTVATNAAPAERRLGRSSVSIHVSPRDRGASGSMETGMRSDASRVTAAPVSPAVGWPSLKSTMRGMWPGASCARAPSSAASRSVPRRSIASSAREGSTCASLRSAAVLSTTAAVEPKATIREWAGRSARLEPVDLLRGLFDRAARHAVRDVHGVDDGLPARAGRHDGPGQRQRERREQQRSESGLRPPLTGIEVRARNRVRQPHERKREQQPQGARRRPDHVHARTLTAGCTSGSWRASPARRRTAVTL